MESLRDLSSKELIQFLKVPIYKIPKLIYAMRKHLQDEIPNLAPIANIFPVLEKLHQAKYAFGILTSNSKENVTKWLDLHNMRHFFSFIHTESNYFFQKICY